MGWQEEKKDAAYSWLIRHPTNSMTRDKSGGLVEAWKFNKQRLKLQLEKPD